MKHTVFFSFVLFIAVSLLAVHPAGAQSKKGKATYHIAITIPDCNDSVLLMGNYYADKTYAIDTAKRENGGRYVFTDDERELLPGLYFFATLTGKYVEFVIYNEKPFFSFSTHGDDWMANMKPEGSAENKAFYDYHSLSRRYGSMDNAPDTSDHAAYSAFMSRISKTMDSVRNDFVKRNPKRMISRMMLATKEPDVPENDPLGVPLEPRQRWEIYVTHYFDNMPLEDDFLVRTPRAVFYDRVMNYCDRAMNGATPEIIIPYLDKMLDRAKASKENFHYLLHTITEKYLQSNIMVYDEIYVHLIKRYYAAGDAFWMSPSDIDKEVSRAERWENLLVGRVAPELVVYDEHERPVSLHAMPTDYKLLIFWSPTCGHCQKTIPLVYEKYMEMRKKCNIGAMAILTDFDNETTEKWKDFIKEHDMTQWGNYSGGVANIDWHEVYDVTSTPQIYLIDKNNKILAKKINEETFESIMEYLLKEGSPLDK
ncbi:MAG: DUF5106 domain-containing protein [Bacteroidales bacterium]|nr:DUF5106 domain-containing protein [Bacteroidales bacterium]